MAAERVVLAINRAALAVVPLVAIVVGALTVFVVPRSSYAFGDDVVATGEARVLAGIALVIAGLLTWLDRPAAIRGHLMSLAAVVVLAPEWEAWFDGAVEARSVAAVAGPFALPLVAHLAFAEPSGRLAERRWRAVVAVAYAGGAIWAVTTALFRDPFFDPACSFFCAYNVFLVSAQPALVVTVGGLVDAGSLVLGITMAVAGVLALGTTTARGTALRRPLLVPGGILGTVAAAGAGLRLVEDVAQPRALPFAVLSLAWSVGLIALGAGSLLVTARSRQTRAAVARLAAELGDAPPPGSLGAVLRRATGDASLAVVYPLPDGEHFVDASGQPVGPPVATLGHIVTPVVRQGSPVAFVVHDATALDAEEIRREVGAAARMAVENERLRAQVLAQLADLRASRVRLVETADAERRRLERDLHDGAQQRLLALGFDLRLAAASAAGGPAAPMFAAAIDGVGAAISALRDLAHGIYPAVLTGAGLGPAIHTLASDGRVPVEVAEVPDRRFSPRVERTAYEVVSEGLEAAAAVGTSRVTVRATTEGDDLIVEVDGAGDGPFIHLADRVGALGGRLVCSASRLRAEIPCAS